MKKTKTVRRRKARSSKVAMRSGSQKQPKTVRVHTNYETQTVDLTVGAEKVVLARHDAFWLGHTLLNSTRQLLAISRLETEEKNT